MHYRTKALGLLGRIVFAKENKFIEAVGTRHTSVKTLNVSNDGLAPYAGVVTMQYD